MTTATTSRRVRIGFIGAGFSAALQAEGLLGVHGVEVRLTAVVATSRTSADAFAARFGVPTVHARVADLLADREVDAVCICVPNALHAELVIAAARAGKHIICEKPLTGAFVARPPGATDIERAALEQESARASTAAIADEVARAGVIFGYAENWIYAPAMTKISRLLAASAGPVLDIRAEESHSGSHARRSRRRETAGGGALLMLGSHPIGAVLHLKDRVARDSGIGAARPVSVTAEVRSLYDSPAVRGVDHDWLVSDWDDVETWACTMIGFDDGTTAVVTASFAMLGGIRNTLEVHTTNAVFRARMTPNDSLQIYSPDEHAFGAEYLQEKIETRTGWISAAPDEDWERGYPQEMQDFVTAIATGRQPLAGLDLACGVVDIIYASYRSAAEGRRIELSRPGSEISRTTDHQPITTGAP